MQSRLSGNIHLVEGTHDSLPVLLRLLEESGIKQSETSDDYIRTYTHFGINDAQDISTRARTKALGHYRLFILIAPTFSNEAQNALLKTIEESNLSSYFFFIVPSPHLLLGTIRSRSQILILDGITPAHQSVVDVRAYLSSTSALRLELLKPLLEKGEDDKRDLNSILQFLSEVEQCAKKMTNNGQAVSVVREVYAARKYSMDKGALVKVLLERMALLTPQVDTLHF